MRKSGMSRPVGVALILACVLALACGTQGPVPPEPPVIEVQPAAITVVQCQSAVLGVTARGTPPLSFQWAKDGQAIAGATAAVYVVDAAQPSSAGAYSVTVTNAAGTVMSSLTPLSVEALGPPPTEPTVLLEEDAAAPAFAGDRLFWVRGAEIRATSAACPGVAETTFYVPFIAPMGLIGVGDTLYWIDGNAGSQGVFATSARTGTTTKIAQLAFQPSDFFEASGQLIWTDSPFSEIQSMPVGGELVATLSLRTSAPRDQVVAVATDGDFYYWSGWAGESWSVVNTMAVSRTPVVGGASVVLAGDQGEVSDVATDGTRVYWAGTEGSAPDRTSYLRSIDVGGLGPIQQLGTMALSQWGSVVLNGNALFWSTAAIETPEGTIGSGALMVVQTDGSQPPTVLAASEVGPTGLVVREGYLYWTESSRPHLPGRGRIMRMGQP